VSAVISAAVPARRDDRPPRIVLRAYITPVGRFGERNTVKKKPTRISRLDRERPTATQTYATFLCIARCNDIRTFAARSVECSRGGKKKPGSFWSSRFFSESKHNSEKKKPRQMISTFFFRLSIIAIRRICLRLDIMIRHVIMRLLCRGTSNS